MLFGFGSRPVERIDFRALLRHFARPWIGGVVASRLESKLLADISWRGVLPMPDPRSWVTYLTLGALAASTFIALALTGLRLSIAWGWAFAQLALVLIFVAWMLRRAGHSAISSGLETVALAYLVSMAGAIIQYPLMALPFPFTDALLDRMDLALGFDWWAFLQLFGNPLVWAATTAAYSSIILQTLTLLVLLCSTGRQDRAWHFLTAGTVAMAVTMILLPFFPADGSLTLCSLPTTSPWIVEGACNYGPAIHQLKAGQIKILDEATVTGLVTFPSFHAAIALQFAWGFWPYRYLRWPALGLNILMCCGAIVIASHYLVDLLAGFVIAVLSIKVSGPALVRFMNRSAARITRQCPKSTSAPPLISSGSAAN